MTPSSSAGRASFPTKPSPPRSSTACFTTAPSSAFSESSWPREAPRGLSYPPQSARTPRPHQSLLPLQVHSSGRGWPSTHPTVVPPEASPCNPARSYGAPWQSAAHHTNAALHGRRRERSGGASLELEERRRLSALAIVGHVRNCRAPAWQLGGLLECPSLHRVTLMLHSVTIWRGANGGGRRFGCRQACSRTSPPSLRFASSPPVNNLAGTRRRALGPHPRR